MMMMMDNLNFPINLLTGAEMNGDKCHDILLLKICSRCRWFFTRLLFWCCCCFVTLMSLHG